MTDDIYDGIKEVKQITPDDVERCQPCDYLPTDFADTINHYITCHGYRLLHVGSHTTPDGANVLSELIALLGK